MGNYRGGSMSGGMPVVVGKANPNTIPMFLNNALTNSSITDSGSLVTIANPLALTSTISISGQIKSLATVGTPPLSVVSPTMVPNLNVDMVDGKHASDFLGIAGGTVSGHVIFDSGSIVSPELKLYSSVRKAGIDNWNGRIRFIDRTDNASRLEIDLSTGQIGSNTPQGTAPLTVSSTTLVGNLNADMVDSLHANANATALTLASRDSSGNSAFNILWANSFQSNAAQGTPPIVVTSTTFVPNLNVDTVDGFHLNQDVRTTASPTFSSPLITSTFRMTSTAPVIDLTETDQALDEKRWWIAVDAKSIQFRTVTDAGSSGATALSINRGAGTAIASIGVNAPIVSTVATGNQPLFINSTTLVKNLNADLLRGWLPTEGESPDTIVVRDSIARIRASRFVATETVGPPIQVTSTSMVTNLNVDMIDSFHAAIAASANTIVVRDGYKKITEVPVVRSNVINTVLPNANNPLPLASYTPVVTGNYEAKSYLRLTSAANVSVEISYADSSGDQYIKILNNEPLAAGSYSLPTAFFTATTAKMIRISYTASVGNVVYVSAIIQEA